MLRGRRSVAGRDGAGVGVDQERWHGGVGRDVSRRKGRESWQHGNRRPLCGGSKVRPRRGRGAQLVNLRPWFAARWRRFRRCLDLCRAVHGRCDLRWECLWCKTARANAHACTQLSTRRTLRGKRVRSRRAGESFFGCKSAATGAASSGGVDLVYLVAGVRVGFRPTRRPCHMTSAYASDSSERNGVRHTIP